MRWFRNSGAHPRDRGVTTVEYGIIVAGVGIAAITGIFALRGASEDAFTGTIESDGVVTCAPGNPNCDAYAALPAANIPANPVSLLAYSVLTGSVATSFSSSPVVSGGTAPFQYSLQSGSLPPGLTGPDASTGVISGTPSSSGSQTFTVGVIDSNGMSASKSVTFTINAASVNLSGYSPLAGAVGQAISSSPVVAGGASPFTFSLVSGTLPGGVTGPNATTGVVSGTPTAAGSSTVSITVTDANATTSTASVTFVTSLPVSLTGYSPTSGSFGTAFTSSPTVTGGTAPLTYSLVSGTLPAGLTGPNATTGVVSGTPTATGSTTVSIKVTGANGSTSTTSVTFVIAATAPGQPTGLTGNKGAVTKTVDLGWTAPASNGGVAIDYYRVEYKTGTTWTSLGTSLGTAATVIMPGSNVSYTFRVTAHNSVGFGTPSATANSRSK